MTKEEILTIVTEQLAVDLNCGAAELWGEKDRFIFAEAADNPGRRPFRRGRQYFEMLTMGRSIVVSATPERLSYAKEQLEGKERDDAFSLPFICGHAMFYLPDLDRAVRLSPPEGFDFEEVGREGTAALRALPGLPNAVQYDETHPVQNEFTLLARSNGRVAAAAGGYGWSARMWSVGVDVLPEFRGRGLAAYLSNRIMTEALAREIVPVYGTASSNVASQRTGYRAGFMPAWMSDRRVRFEGSLRND